MIKLIGIYIFSLMASVLRASDLEISAYYGMELLPRQKQVSSPKRRLYQTGVVLRNCATKELLIPKANIGPSFGSDTTGRIIVSFSYVFEEFNGSRIKPSIYEFVPVRLFPGEVVVINYLLDVPVDQDMNNVYIEYEIPTDVAAEFGFWSGKLTCHLEPLKSNPKGQSEAVKP